MNPCPDCTIAGPTLNLTNSTTASKLFYRGLWVP